MPFRHCSIRYNMGPASPLQITGLSAGPRIPRRHQAMTCPRKTRRQKRTRFCRPVSLDARSIGHLALLKVLVLIVLDDGGDRLQPVLVALLDRILEVEILDRDVVGPELEVAAHRLEVGL